jgi:heat shock protein HslJ
MPTRHEITRTLRIMAASAVAVVLLATSGCGGDRADTRSETAGMPSILQDLQDDHWVLDQAASTPRIHSDQAVTLVFADRAVHGDGPCNAYRADLDIDQDSVEDDSISISHLISTQRACDDQRAETAYFAALQAVTKVDVDHEDGRLVLTGPAGVRLEFDTFDATDLIVDTWKVVGLATGDALSTPIASTEPSLTFSEGGDLSVVTGCNRASGSWELDGNEMSIGPLATTKKLCPEPDGVMAQEAAMLKALESVVRAEIAPDRLTLLARHEVIALVAVPAT